jgi:hypothetical protein
MWRDLPDMMTAGACLTDNVLGFCNSRYDRLEFIPIKPLAATGSGGPGSYAGHSRFPSRHHGRPASTGGFDDATALDTAVDMLDPQSTTVEHLVGSLLRQWQFRARWKADTAVKWKRPPRQESGADRKLSLRLRLLLCFLAGVLRLAWRQR